MKLKKWIKKIDPIIDVAIWGEEGNEPLYNGPAFDIPWSLINLQIRKKTEKNSNEPIYICTYKNNNNTILPLIVINVIDK